MRTPPESLDVPSSKADGHNYSMLFTCCPVSSKETIQWFFTSRDWALHRPDDDWRVFDAIVMEHDRTIVRASVPRSCRLI